MNVGGWLRRLGLEPYEAAFRENAINEAILSKLTAGDLKDIGVAAVGHRRVLLDAIAALRGETRASIKEQIIPPGDENARRRIGGSDLTRSRVDADQTFNFYP
jgi:hypothetical protein